MRPICFHLRASEQRKLQRFQHTEIDALTHRRQIRQERDAARQEAQRQALRASLGYAAG